MNLRWNDVDLVKSEVVVRESKTLAGRRVVPLSEFCKAELVRWRELTGPEFSAFVFPNLSNPSKPLRSVRKTWSTALRNAGLNPFPIYSLRATFASRLGAAGERNMQNVARAYRKDLESILGRVIFHPVQFRKAVPLKKVQEEWVRVRKASRNAALTFSSGVRIYFAGIEHSDMLG
jgi:hypothetical protein